MHYGLIIAGGSGTRLWPMSQASLPKQLIPFINGKSLLQLAWERMDGFIPVENRYICAGESHRAAITQSLQLKDSQFLGEPMGRDTVNAVGLAAAVIAQRDPQAVIATFTADHLIEPVADFQRIVNVGFAVAEQKENALVTFGITPTEPATGFGYLQLGSALDGFATQENQNVTPRVVTQFREKPELKIAQEFLAAGAEKYLWNSGMFVWRASALLDCLSRYEPATRAGLDRIAKAWATPNRSAVLHEIYPTLKKLSVDFAVMEPASRDAKVLVAAVPMNLRWLDIGSWPSFAKTCEIDEQGNAKGQGKTAHLDTHRTIIASSDPHHLIATIGCEDLIIIHTPNATLICKADQAERIKQLHAQIGQQHGTSYQ